jgi:hypothetical protein
MTTPPTPDQLRRFEALTFYLTDDQRISAYGDPGDGREYRIVWKNGEVVWVFLSRLGVACYVLCRTKFGDPPRYVEEMPKYRVLPALVTGVLDKVVADLEAEDA